MNLHDTTLTPRQAAMVESFLHATIDSEPAVFAATHLAPHVLVGGPGGATTISGAAFASAMASRAHALQGTARPELRQWQATAAGDTVLVSAEFGLWLGERALTLISDYLLSVAGADALCHVYLTRQDLLGMLGNEKGAMA